MKEHADRLMRLRKECEALQRDIEEGVHGGELIASPLYGVESAINDTLGRLVAGAFENGTFEWNVKEVTP